MSYIMKKVLRKEKYRLSMFNQLKLDNLTANFVFEIISLPLS